MDDLLAEADRFVENLSFSPTAVEIARYRYTGRRLSWSIQSIACLWLPNDRRREVRALLERYSR